MRWKTMPVKQKLPKINHESNECVLFNDFVKKFHPDIYPDFERHECGGSRGKYERMRLAQEGQKRGFPDFVLYYSCGHYHGLVIEMKKANKPGERKGKIMPWQKERMERFIYRGYSGHFCFGVEEAINVLQWYLKLT